MTGLVDLDELALRCRDEQARGYIREAVASYKAGAFRSCIVSTWNAVVFDYLHKLREMEMSGDANAKQRLEEFERIRKGGESRLKEALGFERGLLDTAEADFELIGPLEKEDLARLQRDRNRCAHPSMQSAEDPYQPTAELARAHLRNAVEIMLQREPVQGKAALKLVWDDIQSPLFPKEVDAAMAHLRSGPFRRARKALVRNLVILLIKNILTPSNSVDGLSRICAALAAVNQLYRSVSEETIKTDFVRLIRSVSDTDLWRLLAICRYVPFAWETLDDPFRSKLSRYIETVPNDNSLVLALWHGTHVPYLKIVVRSRMGDLTSEQLAWLVAVAPSPEYLSCAIKLFATAGSYRRAEYLAETLLLPLAALLRTEDMIAILDAVVENSQIWNAGYIPEKLARLFDATKRLLTETASKWQWAMSCIQDKRGQADFLRYCDPIIQAMKASEIWPPPQNAVSSAQLVQPVQ